MYGDYFLVETAGCVEEEGGCALRSAIAFFAFVEDVLWRAEFGAADNACERCLPVGSFELF